MRGLTPSLKLEGGARGRGVIRNMPSGVCARAADARNDIALSGRYDMAVPGRDADETCTLGMGIMERLGGRAGKLFRPPDTDAVGDRARCMSDVGLISPSS